MGPKKGRAGKSRCNESTEDEPLSKVARNIFVNEAAAGRYSAISSRNFVIERGFALMPTETEGVIGRINQDIREMGWGVFCRQPMGKINTNMTVEFYANFKDREIDENGNEWVTVRGKQFSVTPAIINAHYNTPNYNDDEHEFRLFSLDPDYGAVLSEIAGPGATWTLVGGDPKHLKYKYLTRHAKAWMHFVSVRLFPIMHRSDVHKEVCFLIYAIIRRMKIDVGKIIHVEMTNVNYESVRNLLPYPALVTQLCTIAEVIKLGNESERKCTDSIGDNMILRQLKDPEILGVEAQPQVPARERRHRRPSTSAQQAEEREYVAYGMRYMVEQIDRMSMYERNVAEFNARNNPYNEQYPAYGPYPLFAPPVFPAHLYQVPEDAAPENAAPENAAPDNVAPENDAPEDGIEEAPVQQQDDIELPLVPFVNFQDFLD